MPGNVATIRYDATEVQFASDSNGQLIDADAEK